jgi:MoaA/NifB/PqqE/SkfB family radical SAM enzyme
MTTQGARPKLDKRDTSLQATNTLDISVLRSALPVDAPAWVRSSLATLVPVVYAFLGARCDLRCPYCSLDEPSFAWRADDELHHAMARGAAAGFDKLMLIGGEPTLREDLPALIQRGRELGFRSITITTNGQRIHEATLRAKLLQAGLTHVQISLHAADPAQHDAFVDQIGAGERALASLDACLAEPALELALTSVVAAPTLDGLPAMIELVAAASARRARAIPYYLQVLRPVGRARHHLEQLVPKPRALAEGLRRALVLAERLDVRALYTNLPVCALPGLELLSADRWLTNQRLTAAGQGIDVGHRREGYTKLASCASCPFDASCGGIDTSLLALAEDGLFGVASR